MADIEKKMLSEIISAIPELLEKYDIAEPREEWVNKKKDKEETNGEILSLIIGETIRKEYSLDILTKKIIKKIDIPSEKAERLAEEIKKMITRREKRQGKTEDSKNLKEDPYREEV